MRRVNKLTAEGVYLPEGRHPIIPTFHHSRCERSEPKFNESKCTLLDKYQ
jgi:hypothetical protein